MKRSLVTGVYAVLGLGLVWGCEEGDRAVSPVDSPVGSIGEPVVLDLSEDRPATSEWRIVGGHRQAATGRVEIVFDIAGERHVMVSNSIGNGREFELADASGDKFGISFGHDGERFLLSEWTETDRLDIAIQELRGGRVAETYRLNDAERTWVVDADADVPAELYDEFQSFMPPENSLNRNAIGDRLAALLTDPRLAEEVDAHRWGHEVAGASSDLLRLPEWLEWTCAGFTACQLLKCPWGGPANSLCNFCVGGTLTCILMVLMW